MNYQHGGAFSLGLTTGVQSLKSCIIGIDSSQASGLDPYALSPFVPGTTHNAKAKAEVRVNRKLSSANEIGIQRSANHPVRLISRKR